MGRILHEGHVIVVNFPGPARVRQVLRELSSDPQNRDQELVVLTDAIQSLPFDLPHVSFVQGSPLERDSYERANLARARIVLVLAPDYSDPHSDAIASSIASVVKNLASEVYVVAECLDDNHRLLFDAARCDSIVCGPQISSNLLTQELHDPGVARTLEVITSNLEKPTTFSAVVDDDRELEYTALARRLLEEDANLLGVIRDRETHTTFRDLRSRRGDRVVYLAEDRRSWQQLQE